MPSTKSSNYLTPPEVALELRVHRDKVLGWIRSGELPAVNLATRGKRPRYRVSRDDLNGLLKRRQAHTALPKPARSKFIPPAGIIDFYP